MPKYITLVGEYNNDDTWKQVYATYPLEDTSDTEQLILRFFHENGSPTELEIEDIFFSDDFHNAYGEHRESILEAKKAYSAWLEEWKQEERRKHEERLKQKELNDQIARKELYEKLRQEFESK